MSTSLKIDRLQLDIIINSDPARMKMMELETSMKKVRAEMKQVAKEKGPDSKEYKKLDAELKKLQTDFDKVQEGIGLTGLTMKELMGRSRELKAILSQLRPNTPQWKEYNTQLQAVKGRMAELNGQAKASSMSFSKMADGFNKYFGMIGAIIASFAGIIIGFRKAVDSFNLFEQTLANLSALTGLAGDDLNWLGDQAKKLSVGQTESGILITKSATDILEAYKLMGSAKPELLKNKEALASVTEQALILAQAASMDTAPAVEALASIMNQFGAPASEANKYINILAAGSKAGAAEVDDLADSIVRSGAAATSANITIQQEVALIEALAEKGIKAERAGTGLRGMILKLQKGADEFNPKVVGLNQALQNLSNANLSAKDMMKMFGEESFTVAKIIIDQKDRVKDLTTAVTDTNVAMEQASINTSTNGAKLEQAKNQAALYAIELGEKLAPVMTFSTNILGKFLRLISASIDFYRNNSKVINTLVITIGAYIVATKTASLIESIRNKEGLAGIAITKIKVFWDNAVKIGTLAAAAAQALFTGNLIRARAAMALMTKTMNINPFVLLATAVVALGYAFYELGKKADVSTRFTKAMVDVQAEVAKNVAGERFELEKLLMVAKDKRRSDEERQAAIKKLNDLSPEFLGNLTLETINTKKATAAVDAYLVSLQRKWKLEILENKIKEEQAKGIDIANSELQDNVKWYNDLWNSMLSGGNAVIKANMDQKDALKNKNKDLGDQVDLVKKLGQQYKDAFKDTGNTTDAVGNPVVDEGTTGSTNNSGGDGDSKVNKDREDYNALIKKYNKELVDDKLESLRQEYLAELEHVDKLKITAEEKKQAQALLENVFSKKGREALPGLKGKSLEDLANEEKINREKKLTNEMQAEADKRVAMAEISAERQSEAFKKSLQQQEEALRKYSEFYQSTIGFINEGVAGMVNGQKDAMKEAAKNIILMALDQLKLQAEIAATGVTIMSLMQPDSVATMGVTGMIRAGILIALIEAAFAAVKAKVSQFADGNLMEVIGAQDGKQYSAQRESSAQNKVYSRPTVIDGLGLVGEKGPELVLNGPTTANLRYNYPHLMQALKTVYVPQYAAGNLHAGGQDQPAIDQKTFIAMATYLSDISRKLDNPNRNYVVLTEINKKNAKLNRIIRKVGGAA